MKAPESLPVAASLPALTAALASHPGAVLVAPPGAGKTTTVPVALLDQPWLAGRRILMLEPRRLAARAAARRMAALLREPVGERVGFRVRFESKVSAATRIEVVTEGILTWRFLRDPGLEGVGLVIFDEFHERSLESDLALALALDAQAGLGAEFRLLVMSATIDGAAVAALLGGVPVVIADARAWPVQVHHVPRRRERRLEDDMAALIHRALAETEGDVLAFLPGEREIRATLGRLAAELPPGVLLAPLFGALSSAEQDRAIQPAPRGARKVVLATTIAETSLTIEGVRTVVDCGLKRRPHFDPASGMSRLETVRVSQAAATQRAGRAGRLGPGHCYRLWEAAEERALAAFDTPEIRAADLAPLALQLAAWGTVPDALAWLDAPPAAAYAQATALLRRLSALDDAGRITGEGRAMAALPLHPRLAHMVLRGKAIGRGALAADLAALLSERDTLGERGDADIQTRLERLAAPGGAHGVRAVARQIRRLARISGEPEGTAGTGVLIALAYPDRVAAGRGGRFLLAGGGGAVVAPHDALAGAEFLAIATLDGAAEDARVYLAAPLTRAEIAATFADEIELQDVIAWDSRQQAVIQRREERLGAILLGERPLTDPDQTRLRAAMLAGVRNLGVDALPWTAAARSLQARIAFLALTLPEMGFPDLGDAALLARMEDWLGPHLAGCTRRSHLAGLDLAALLRAQVPPALLRRLEDLAPTHLPLPAGGRAAIDYGGDGGPQLRVRLQEMFGQAATPRVAGGRVAVVVELLSPAGRGIALTSDLASFWAGAYAQVRAEMRGRYPKHPWPEDPMAAAPRGRATRPRLSGR
ncbi:MAG: ATP-dependent helicase HrpB [Alphaproteobacteria bacterium]|nr:ATP-dependent helicase HrpB [Alphaproteobacteria bacterium]